MGRSGDYGPPQDYQQQGNGGRQQGPPAVPPQFQEQGWQATQQQPYAPQYQPSAQQYQPQPQFTQPQQYQPPQYAPPQYAPPQFPPAQYPPQYPPQFPPQYAPQPQRRRHTARNVLAGSGALIAVIIVISVAANSGHSAQTAGSPQVAAPAKAAAPGQPAAKAAAVAKTVATFSGSGVQSTPPFTVTPTWRLDYKFDCSTFGYKGNFIVMEDGGLTGAMDVNTLAMSKAGTSYAYNDAGQHYLKIDSECSWSVKVIDEG
jgi:hypothetical protein